MTKYNVQISQRAYSDILECVLFVKNVSEDAANNLYKEIMSAIESLKVFPNINPNIDGLFIADVPVKKMLIHEGRYLIVYKVVNDIVEIYDVIDSRKDNSILKL